MAARRQAITLSLTKLCGLEAGYWLFLVPFLAGTRFNLSDDRCTWAARILKVARAATVEDATRLTGMHSSR
jgi:hypothetical protein